jgi:hypothetical protein
MVETAAEMLSECLEWAVIALPTVAGLMLLIWPITEPRRSHKILILVSCVLFSGLIWWQQSFTRREHSREVADLSRNIATQVVEKMPDNSKILERLSKASDASQIISELRSIIDPSKKPIASAMATVTVDVLTDDPQQSAFGLGGWVAFGSGHDTLLMGYTQQTYATGPNDKGIAEYRIVCTSPGDSPYMGKPISKLLDSQYIQSVFNEKFLPIHVQVTGGKVVWVINNAVTLAFEIPPQRAEKKGIFIWDLNDGMKPLREAKQ